MDARNKSDLRLKGPRMSERQNFSGIHFTVKRF